LWYPVSIIANLLIVHVASGAHDKPTKARARIKQIRSVASISA
jgi:hypothetical protein